MPPATRKPTKQQLAVVEALQSVSDFTSAQTLHAHLRDSGRPVGLATVYRTLQAMAANGDVDVLRTDDGEAVYRACSSSHHHHLVCRQCGKTIEVEGDPVERWTTQIAEEHGFDEVTHSLEIFGRCGDCHSER